MSLLNVEDLDSGARCGDGDRCFNAGLGEESGLEVCDHKRNIATT